MNSVRKFSIARRSALPGLALLSLALLCALTRPAAAEEKPAPAAVQVKLSEWKVTLSPDEIPPGPVTLQVTNGGTIPHAFEIEGHGIEKSTARIQPGGSATLAVDLPAGKYEAYCPIGKGSHRVLGMLAHLSVGDDEKGEYEAAGHAGMADMERGEYEEEGAAGGQPVKAMRVVGGGPVIQILPGPYPFADSAMAVIQTRPDAERADLTKKAHMGPYSDNVAKISGDISILAVDRGASGDSVSGTAEFTTKEGARWRLVMDRVQTKDIPFNPRFGGVIMGLFYHGSSGVHTPLVPTIQSSLALWSVAHLYRNGALVTDDAMVHVMLLSRTRRTKDWALDCWDCSDRPIEELQLQVTPAPGAPAFDAPGGFLFVNWEKSRGRAATL